MYLQRLLTNKDILPMADDRELLLTNPQKRQELRRIYTEIIHNKEFFGVQDSILCYWFLTIESENLWDVMTKDERLFWSTLIMEGRGKLPFDELCKQILTPLEKWLKKHKMSIEDYKTDLSTKREKKIGEWKKKLGEMKPEELKNSLDEADKKIDELMAYLKVSDEDYTAAIVHKDEFTTDDVPSL